MQSPLYRCLKNFTIVKKLRKRHRGEFFTNEDVPDMPDVDITEVTRKYKLLRMYYVGMLERVDLIHFNSSVTEAVYKKYISPKNSSVMTITHQSIVDNRAVNRWEPSEKLKITCLAPAKPFKGYNILKAALDELWTSGKRDFELKMFSPVQNPSPYMKVQEEGYSQAELGKIMADTDVLVAPSICYETFGFTVLEAISYGVPVIISDHVGAKDIVGSGGIVVKAGSVDELKSAFLEMTRQKLYGLRGNIQKNEKMMTWREFLDVNCKLYANSLANQTRL
jgi:hypothetical protein